MKAATRCGLKKRGEADISIHAAREGGDHVAAQQFVHIKISIHAAREGGDLAGNVASGPTCHFNPRRP